MPDALWVVGGKQRGESNWTKEWRLYEKALVVKVEDGGVERVLEYQSPPEHRSDHLPSVVFKAATVKGARAYLCTQTEVLICDFPSFAIRKVVSLPCFNDVHHVAVADDGRLFAAITGLDAVAELSADGTLLHLTSVAGGSVWDRFSQTTDYRKVPTTKPHRAHPNFVFFLDGEPWVTRFEQCDAVPLGGDGNGRPSFQLGHKPPHDGIVLGDQIYFTRVDGFVLRFDLSSGQMQPFDLNGFPTSYPERPLGWCRGVLPLGERTWVGFSRIRFTTLRHNLDWARHKFRRSRRYPAAPTRIACYDLAGRALIEEIDLEPAGMNTVFSIHLAGGA